MSDDPHTPAPGPARPEKGILRRLRGGQPKKEDLQPLDLSELSWVDGTRGACLAEVYSRVTRDTRTASAWYQLSRTPKKRAAMFLRGTAVLLLSASGVAPLAVALQPGNGSLDPLAVSLMVAVAAALFGLDKFFNYSAGWMRYVRTDLALRTALSDFEFEWQIARSAWTAPEPTPEQVADMLGRCQAFSAKVNGIVTDETNVWITEFQASLAQLGESLKATEAEVAKRVEAEATRRAEAERTGALNVTVKHDGQIWSGPIRLQVDDRQHVTRNGPTVALTELPAGLRRLSAEVSISNKLYRGEKAVGVEPDKILDASVEVAATN